MIPPSSPLRFGEGYREDLTLDDGTAVHLRLIRPDDKAMLLEGFAHLSEESRYRRFLAVKATLSPTELRYLTECDGIDHLAIVASRPAADGQPVQGLAVARIIRLPDRPDTAEAAITVIDEAQNKGLGRLLGERLVRAALERGIRYFRVMLLAGNDRARALLDEAAPLSMLKPALEAGDGTLTFEIELPELPPPPAQEPLWREAWHRLLTLAAQAYALTRAP